MPRSSRTPERTIGARTAALLLAGTAGVLGAAVAPAAAAPPDDVIVLPGATSAEGIARGEDATFYAGDLFRGDVFRGDLEKGTAELFIDAPDGRMAVGMAADRRHDLLFVAGGFTGQAYVYDLDTGATVATYQFASPAAPDAPPATVVNDVTVTRGGAWFTDSRRAALYFVPVTHRGEPGDFRTLELHGPAADTSGEFNLNGIVAACSGDTLVVAHSTKNALYTVDPGTGDSAEITGVSLPGVDGIVLEGRDLWAVQNTNQVTQVRLSHDLSSGRVEEVITDADFQTPSTAIRYDDHLAVVNAKFDTGLPPTADSYEVVLVDD
jgi:sugar lactone lactonase YvrE